MKEGIGIDLGPLLERCVPSATGLEIRVRPNVHAVLLFDAEIPNKSEYSVISLKLEIWERGKDDEGLSLEFSPPLTWSNLWQIYVSPEDWKKVGQYIAEGRSPDMAFIAAMLENERGLPTVVDFRTFGAGLKVHITMPGMYGGRTVWAGTTFRQLNRFLTLPGDLER